MTLKIAMKPYFEKSKAFFFGIFHLDKKAIRLTVDDKQQTVFAIT